MTARDSLAPRHRAKLPTQRPVHVPGRCATTKTLCQADWDGFGFPTAHLYLQMSSPGNYPAREVFFDEVTVRSR